MLKKLVMAWALFFICTAPALARAGDLLILVDLSQSSAHVQSAPTAAKMGAYAARLISGLPLGARVSLRTFGLPEAARNWLALDYRLLRKRGRRPRDAARKVKLLLANIPRLASENKLALQPATHLLRALQDLAGHACRPGGSLLIISDLMEYSPDADCYRLVKRDAAHLPAPPAGLLRGVKVIALGAGQGLAASRQSRRLEAMWSEWFKRAGAAEFRYVPRL